jgi:hypothetical protein
MKNILFLVPSVSLKAFLAYFNFERKNVGLRDDLPVCVFMCDPP